MVLELEVGVEITHMLRPVFFFNLKKSGQILCERDQNLSSNADFALKLFTLEI